MEQFKDILSLKEASVISGYHSDYLSYLIRNGKLKGKKMGRSWFITRADLDEYLSTTRFLPIANLFFYLVSAQVLLIISFIVIVILGFVIYFRLDTTQINSPVVPTADKSLEIDSDLRIKP